MTELGLDTPIAAYGIRDVSRPVAAHLLGFGLRTLNRMIAEGVLFDTSGNIHLSVPIDQIEALRGFPITAHQYLMAITKRRRCGTPPSSDDTGAFSNQIEPRGAPHTGQRSQPDRGHESNPNPGT